MRGGGSCNRGRRPAGDSGFHGPFSFVCDRSIPGTTRLRDGMAWPRVIAPRPTRSMACGAARSAAPSGSSARRAEVARAHIGPGPAALLGLACLLRRPSRSDRFSRPCCGSRRRCGRSRIRSVALALQHAGALHARDAALFSTRGVTWIFSQHIATGGACADRRSSRRGSAPRARSAPRTLPGRRTAGGKLNNRRRADRSRSARAQERTWRHIAQPDRLR